MKPSSKLSKKTALLLSALLASLPLLASSLHPTTDRQTDRVATATTQLPAPDTIPAQMSHVLINGAVGKLSAEVYRPPLPAGTKTPLVILMHGFMSSKQDWVITNIASGLQEQGIAYIRFDFNGHGESEGDFQDMTVVNEMADAKKVWEYARSLDFVGSIALLGHSQGGVVASMTAGELGSPNIAALVLMAPAAVLKDDALQGRLFGVRYDPLNPPPYVELSGRRLGREFIRTAQKLPLYETAARYAGPVCILHGTSDEIVPYSYAVRYKDGFKQAEIHLLEGENHAFSHNPEEAKDLAIKFLLNHGQ